MENYAEEQRVEGHMVNQVTVIDYTKMENSIYINLEVFDAAQNKIFAEEVRFLGDLLYGDILHDRRSQLTDSCRLEAIEYLRNYFSQ